MEKAYIFRNGQIDVMLPETCDRERLKKVTEEFLKKVIAGGNNNGYSNTTRNLAKEQILDR